MSDSEKLRTFIIDDTEYTTRYTGKYERRTPYTPPNPKHVLAFIPGVIQEVCVTPGQKVRWGDSLLVLEAMKMKNDVTADFDGTIRDVKIKKGDRVMKKQLLIEFE